MVTPGPEAGEAASLEARPLTRPLSIPIRIEPPRRGFRLPRWPTRSPAWLTLILPLLAAVAGGVVAGYLPLLTLAAFVGGSFMVAMMVRLDWAIMLVVAAAAFDDYLLAVDPRLTKGLAALLVGSWLLRRCAGPLHLRRYSPVMMSALAFVVVLLAATVWHSNGSGGQAVVIRYAGFLAVLVVIADALRGKIITPTAVARVFVLASTVAALVGLASYALGVDRRVGGPIGDPGDFGFFLITAVPFALALRRTGRNPRRTWPYDLSALIVLVAIAGTFSRGAMLGVIAMAGFALVARMVRLRAAIGIGLVLGTALSFTVAAFPDLVSVSLQQKEYVAGQNVDERLQLWQAAGDMTLENPVLGRGPGSFALYHRDYVGAMPADINHRLDVAHNTYLEVSSELGFVGLAVFLFMMGAAFIGAWSGWKRKRDPLAAAVCAALVGTMVASTFVTEQYALPLWLLVAFGAFYGIDEREPSS